MTDAAMDWDKAYNNMGHIAGSQTLPAVWTARAQNYRDDSIAAGRRIALDLPYGDHPRERLDIVYPDGTPKGLVVFVHGGYWMRLDKSFWTDLAEGARAQGWAVCLPSYTLAPATRVRDITQQIGRAISIAATQVEGPIHLAGHSAGGHLVSRMLCADSPLPDAVFLRIRHTLSISGVHDLRPLLRTEMNTTLNLDLAEARAESPALHQPKGAPQLTTWVGGGELPEFIRQARLMAMIWEGFDAHVQCRIDGDHHHFSVVEGLKDPKSAITGALLDPALFDARP